MLKHFYTTFSDWRLSCRTITTTVTTVTITAMRTITAMLTTLPRMQTSSRTRTRHRMHLRMLPVTLPTPETARMHPTQTTADNCKVV